MMTRQNCKNCGEPYDFDNLVTPGRATKTCGTCHRKIYIHTGQIFFEPPASHISTNTSVKISLGDGVSIVQDPSLVRESVHIDTRNPSNPLPVKNFKSVQYEEAGQDGAVATISTETEVVNESQSLSLTVLILIVLLYLAAVIMLIMSGLKCQLILQSGTASDLLSWDGVAQSIFMVIIALSAVELIKNHRKA